MVVSRFTVTNAKKYGHECKKIRSRMQKNTVTNAKKYRPFRVGIRVGIRSK
jgi:hypothetical protein